MVSASIISIVSRCGANAQKYLFHEQGSQGPHSYRFGYDTGKGYNHQSRYEERDGYGNVRGYYTYYDPKGNKKTVRYTSSDKGGFSASGDFGTFPRRRKY
ncbi:Uncharacterised protein g1888 [Pycnogonum litorale]